MDKPVERVQSSQALCLGLGLNESFKRCRAVEENLSGFMKSKEQAELGGGEALPVKLVEVLVMMLG